MTTDDTTTSPTPARALELSLAEVGLERRELEFLPADVMRERLIRGIEIAQGMPAGELRGAVDDDAGIDTQWATGPPEGTPRG